MEIRCQTGLRGLAALLVVFAHARYKFFCPDFHAFRSGLMYQNQAVDMFFMLSGFILCHVYLNKQTEESHFHWRKFYLARFARIYPLHIATVAVILLSDFAMQRFGLTDGVENILPHFIGQALLTNAFPHIGFTAWNMPAWSISIEFFCYLLMFPLIFLISKKVKRFNEYFLYGLIFSLVSWIFIYLNLIIPADLTPTNGWPAINRGAVFFTIGFLIYEIVRHENCSKIVNLIVRKADYLVIATIALAVAASLLDMKNMIFYSFPLILVAFHKDSNSWSHRFLASRSVHLIGLLSYSIYLVHDFIFKFFAVIMKQLNMENTDSLASHGILILSQLVVIVTGGITYYKFEIPVRNYLRKVLS